MNGEAVHASPRKTGMIILGGGLPKHHICNANMMRNGADYAVFINTAQEFDGSDSGARPDEAVSWGKIRGSAKTVKVYNVYIIPFACCLSAIILSCIMYYLYIFNKHQCSCLFCPRALWAVLSLSYLAYVLELL